jgi:hypothetical protein
MKIHTIRLKPGADLKTSIEAYINKHHIQAGFIITCVAGLSQATIRMAGATPTKQDIRTFKGDLELTSLVGTVSTHGVHLHMSISDSQGVSMGGHLKEGTLIDPTAEIVIGEDDKAIFTREFDEVTGFDELIVTPKKK